jgi:hypothetical protein
VRLLANWGVGAIDPTAWGTAIAAVVVAIGGAVTGVIVAVKARNNGAKKE